MAFLVENRTIPVIDQIVKNFIHPRCPLILTDKASFYLNLERRTLIKHRMVDHSKNYVAGKIKI